MRTSRKSLWASGISVVICAMLLVGTTFAWFTDSITNSGNKIQAGELNITLSELNSEGNYVEVGESPIFESELWEPGYSDAAVLKVANEGSLALEWRLDLVNKGGEAGILGEVIDVYAKVSEGSAITTVPTSLEAAQADGYTLVGTLNELMADADGAAHGILYAADNTAAGGYSEAYAGVVLHMRESADNDYQGLSVGTTFDIVLNATQYTYEEDGFGSSTYDASAEYEMMLTEEDAINALIDPDATDVDIASDITVTGYDEHAYIISDKNVDFNGSTFTKPDSAGSGLRIGYDPTTNDVVPANVTISNANFVSLGYSPAVRVETGSNATFSDCNFDGDFQAYLSTTSYNLPQDTTMTLVFNNCTFTGEVELGTGGGDYEMKYDVTFNNCTFDTTSTAVMVGYDAGGSVTLNNCKMNVNAGASNGASGIILRANKEDFDLNINYTDITFTCTGNGSAPINLNNSANAVNVSFTSSSVALNGGGNGSYPVSVSAAGDDTAVLNIDSDSVFMMNGTEVEFRGFNAWPEWAEKN